MAEYPDFVETCGYGSVTGILGVNCRHNFHPFILGIMEPTYTAEQLKKIDPPPFEYEGKEYTHYEATQKQRQIERTIRKLKREKAAYQSAGLELDAQTAGAKINLLKQKYTDFSKAAGLRTQIQRANFYLT